MKRPLTLTRKGDTIYNYANMFCKLPISTTVAGKASIEQISEVILSLPDIEQERADWQTAIEMQALVISAQVTEANNLTAAATQLREEIANLQASVTERDEWLANLRTLKEAQDVENAALRAEVERLKAGQPPVINPPPPPPPSPPIGTMVTVTTLAEVQSNLQAGKAVKLAKGYYNGTLNIQGVQKGYVDALGAILNGDVTMSNTQGIQIEGLNSKTDGPATFYVGVNCTDIVLRGGRAAGTHRNPNSKLYQNSNVVSADPEGGSGNFLMEEYQMDDGRNGIAGTFKGDFIHRKNKMTYCADDFLKLAFSNTDSRKEIDDNEMLWPFLGHPEYHRDFIQLRSSDERDMKGLKIRRNVMLCNDVHAQIIGNFKDATVLGHQWIDPEITDNIGASVTWHGFSVTRIKGGEVARNIFVSLPGGDPANYPTPWITDDKGAIGVNCHDNIAFYISWAGTGNIPTGKRDPAVYRGLFPNWDGSTPFTSAQDARMKLKRAA